MKIGGYHRGNTPIFNRPFTARQIEVVRLIARGLHSYQVADELGISVSGARQHDDVLRAKLRCASRWQIPYAYMCRTGDDPYPRPEEAAA